MQYYYTRKQQIYADSKNSGIMNALRQKQQSECFLTRATRERAASLLRKGLGVDRIEKELLRRRIEELRRTAANELTAATSAVLTAIEGAKELPLERLTGVFKQHARDAPYNDVEDCLSALLGKIVQCDPTDCRLEQLGRTINELAVEHRIGFKVKIKPNSIDVKGQRANGSLLQMGVLTPHEPKETPASTPSAPAVLQQPITPEPTETREAPVVKQKFTLLIEDDEGKTTRVPILKERITIGRGQENTIRLVERNISRKHAILHFNLREDTVEIEPHPNLSNSLALPIRVKNGDIINKRTEIKVDDRVKIGDYTLGIVPFDAKQDEKKREVVRIRLRITTQNGEIESREFNNETKIGRGTYCDLCITDVAMSRSHAKVVLALENGKPSATITDLNSGNGTFVNNTRIAKCKLNIGDEIVVGSTRINVEAIEIHQN